MPWVLPKPRGSVGRGMGLPPAGDSGPPMESVTLGASSGMGRMFPQLGHLPFFPPASSGACNTPPHFAQATFSGMTGTLGEADGRIGRGRFPDSLPETAGGRVPKTGDYRGEGRVQVGS